MIKAKGKVLSLNQSRTLIQILFYDNDDNNNNNNIDCNKRFPLHSIHMIFEKTYLTCTISVSLF